MAELVIIIKVDPILIIKEIANPKKFFNFFLLLKKILITTIGIFKNKAMTNDSIIE